MKTDTRRRRKSRVLWIVLLVILGVIVLVLGAGIILTEPGRREIMELDIGAPDFSKLRDGTYVGEYRGAKDSFRDTKVQVTVAEGKVTEIKVLEGALAGDKQSTDLGKGLSLTDLFARVIEARSLRVDTISGATISSKVHLKAVEDALERAKAE